MNKMANNNGRLLQLLFIFANLLRIFGLHPFAYDKHHQSAQRSLRWRIYSALLLSASILGFTGYCSYAILRGNTSAHIMDFVRIFEVLMIVIILFAITVTELCYYKSGTRSQILANRALREIFVDFLRCVPPKIANEWFCSRVVATSWKFLIRAILLMIITISIAYKKFEQVLDIFPFGWNYVVLLLLLIPFIIMSLASSKFCVNIHAFDHGFQMLNKRIQLMVDQLNATEEETVGSLQNNEHIGPLFVLVQGRNFIMSGSRGRMYQKQKLMFEFQQLIHHIRLKHDSLTVLVEQFFQSVPIYVLISLTMNFTLLVIEAFYLFTNVYRSVSTGKDIDMEFAFLNLRASLMVCIELTWTIGACSNLMDNMQRIGVTLNALVTLDVDTGLVQTIETWTIKLLCQPNAVQVFQLFDINNGLLYSIIGAVCGYLVILIQFKLAEGTP